MINKTKIQENQNMETMSSTGGFIQAFTITDRYSDCNNEPPALVFKMVYFY